MSKAKIDELELKRDFLFTTTSIADDEQCTRECNSQYTESYKP